MIRRILFLLIAVPVIFFSCEKDISFDLDIPESALCFNCIMEAGNRDSIAMYISKVQAVDETSELVPILNANIKLWKDGVAQDGITNYGKGVYILKQTPQEGSTYQVEVSVDGYEKLTAQTTVPFCPEAQAWWRKDTIRNVELYGSGYKIFDRLEVKLGDRPGKDFYWVIKVGVYDMYGANYGAFDTQYLTDNLLFDSFNRYARQEYVHPFTNFEYMGALRLDDDNINGDTFNFFTDAYSGLYIINADEHFDKHYKSSIKQFLVYEYDQGPVFEPVQIYSNIENGYGIFGSVAVTGFTFDEKPN